MAIDADTIDVDAFLETDEHDALRDTVRRYADKHWPESEVRACGEAQNLKDPARWSVLGEEIGVFALGLPEDLGGFGGGAGELAIVAEELGRNLACLPFVSTAAATLLLVASRDQDALETLLPRIGGGEAAVALVGSDGTGAWMPEKLGIAAEATEGEWRVTGEATHVIDGMEADALIVLADSPDGTRLFLVEATQPEVSRTAMPALDLTRGMAEIGFTRAAATPIGAPGAGRELMMHGAQSASVLLAAEQLGAAKTMLDASVAHAKFRKQFGRAIGSFQSIKHLLVELSIQFEQALSVVRSAARAFDQDPNTELVSQARVLAAAAFERVAAKSIQVHGGLGFTWEHPAHLYFKRAVASAALWGGVADHRSRLVASLDDRP